LVVDHGEDIVLRIEVPELSRGGAAVAGSCPTLARCCA
jgi:hypothetical protein